MTGPPITRRPCASIPRAPAPGYADGEKTKQPEGSGILPCVLLHEQSFEPFEPEARLARLMVAFDPRHAVVPGICFQHGALHSTGAPNAVRRRGIHYLVVVPNMCELVHMVNDLFRGRLRFGKPVDLSGSLPPRQAAVRGGQRAFTTYVATDGLPLTQEPQHA